MTYGSIPVSHRPVTGRRHGHDQRGFTLLETMLALTIGTMIVSALLGWSVVTMKSQGALARVNMDGASIGFLRTTFLRDVASAHHAVVGSDVVLAACGRVPSDGSPDTEPGEGGQPDPVVPTPGSPPAAVQDGDGGQEGDGGGPAGGAHPGRVIPDDAAPLFRLTDERGRRIVYATAASSRGTNVKDDKARDRSAAGEERTSVWRYTCEGGRVLLSTELVADILPGPVAVSCSPRPAMPADDCGIVRLMVTTVGGETASMAATIRVDAEGVAGSGVAAPEFETPEVSIEASPLEVHRGEPVTFDAHAFVESGDPLTMAWDFGDGTTADVASATHSYSDLGEFTAVFTATTPAGTPSTDFLRVKVTNRRPTAVIAAPADGATVNLCTDVTFSGAGSNDAEDAAYGGHLVNYQWSFGDGNDATVTTATTTHRFTEILSDSGQDELSASLAVEDNDGGVSQAVFTDLTVVNRPPTKPVITAQIGSGPVVSAGGTIAATLPSTVQLRANATDPDGECDELTYRWDLGRGETSDEANPTLVLTSGSSRTVKLKVSDKYGGEVTSDTIRIEVNTPPVAEFTLSPTKARTGDEITVTNTSSDAETPPSGLSYYWVFEHGNRNGSNFTTPDPNPGTVKFSHDQNGTDTFAPGAAGKTYTVTLTVTDPEGASHTTTRTINITGAPTPTGLSVSGKKASWSAVDRVSKYEVEVQHRTCTFFGLICSWKPLGSFESTSPSYTATDSPIKFRVRAMDAYSEKWSAWSDWKD